MSLHKLGISTSCHMKGFTLVELLVSISIMTIILGITLSGGPQSIAKVALSNNTYQTELMLREAQLQGSAVNSVGGLYGGVGVFFDRATSSMIIKFKDKINTLIVSDIGVGDGLFQQGHLGEKDIEYKVTHNHKIGKLCVAENIGPFVCNDEDVTNIINTLTVSFIRPRQRANIYVNDQKGVRGDIAKEYSSACIQIETAQNPTSATSRSIIVYRSGMITKKPGTCH